MRVLVLVTWRSTTAPTNFITGMITSIVIVTASTRTNGNRGQPVADQIQKIMLRALDANIQYYTSLSRLAADCLDGLLGSIANISTQQKASSPSSTWRVTENVPARPVKEESSAPTIVLEGETGSRALGMFVVENGLSHAVSASIYVSAFTDSSGREVRPQIKVEPSVIGLKPKEQILVESWPESTIAFFHWWTTRLKSASQTCPVHASHLCYADGQHRHWSSHRLHRRLRSPPQNPGRVQSGMVESPGSNVDERSRITGLYDPIDSSVANTPAIQDERRTYAG